MDALAFSGLTLHYAIHDINAFLPARIQKIQVLSFDQFVLQLHGQKTFHLYLNLSSHSAKMHRTEQSFDIKIEPTVFILKLKKWFIGATLNPFTQVSKDRVVQSSLKTRNELYDDVNLNLYLEFFGKDANLILTEENGTIIDCLKTSGALFSHPRLIQIGATYQAPTSEKKDPFDPSAVNAYFNLSTRPPLYQYFDGFSKELAQELSTFETPDAFLTALNHPLFYRSQMVPVYRNIDAEAAVTYLEWADHFLRHHIQKRPTDQRRLQILKTLQNRLDRATKKARVLQEQLNDIQIADAYTKEGQALMASPYKNEKHAYLDVTDYVKNETLTLQLDESKTVLENAQLKFKKAKKLKNSKPHLERQLKLNAGDIRYFELVIHQLEEANQDSLEGIIQELLDKKIIKTKAPLRKPKKSSGKLFEAPSGGLIYVGLNNQQNAFLTHEKAKPTDLWFHVRGYPGSHVILAVQNPREEDILKAAQLAAYYSKARELLKVDVDVTPVKFVKKIPGQHGCFVRYDSFKTLSVTPENFKEKRL